MRTVTLITSDAVLASPAAGDRELRLLASALTARGVACEIVDWRAASELSDSDLVVLKSPWDYAGRPAEFLAWLDRAEAQARVVNHPGVIRWNLDKRYLGELAAHGVAVCPTHFCGDPDGVRRALAAVPGRVVVKPTVSASSADTGLFESDDPAAFVLARRILDAAKDVMVQPAIESVGRRGEHSLVHVGGRFVHAVRKGPLLAVGGGLLRDDRREAPVPVEADADERELAEHALAVAGSVLAARGIEEPVVHARVDIARDASGAAVLMELELFEPNLFLDLAPGAEHLYADAVVARLKA